MLGQPIRFQTFGEQVLYHEKEYCIDDTSNFKMYCSRKRLLPFQIPRPVSNTEDLDWSLVDKQGNETAITMPAGDVQVFIFDTQEIIIYNGNLDFDDELPLGQYSIKLDDNEGNVFISELLTIVQFDPDEPCFLKLEWWDDCIVTDLYYTGGYKNRIFVKTDIGKPKYKKIVEGKEDFDKELITELRKTEKYYLFDIVGPEFFQDAINLIHLHKFIEVYDQNENQIVSIRKWISETEWPEIGCIGIARIEAYSDYKIKNSCCDDLTLAPCNCQANCTAVGVIELDSDDYDNFEVTTDDGVYELQDGDRVVIYNPTGPTWTRKTYSGDAYIDTLDNCGSGEDETSRLYISVPGFPGNEQIFQFCGEPFNAFIPIPALQMTQNDDADIVVITYGCPRTTWYLQKLIDEEWTTVKTLDKDAQPEGEVFPFADLTSGEYRVINEGGACTYTGPGQVVEISPWSEEAIAWFTASGISDSDEKDDYDRLVRDWLGQSNPDYTTYNLFGRGLCMYLFPGTGASTAKFNVFNPADSDVAYRATIIGGLTFNDSCIGDGASGYFNSHMKPGTNLGLNSKTFFCYIASNIDEFTFIMGAVNSGTFQGDSLVARLADTLYARSSDGSGVGLSNTDSRGCYVIGRTGASVDKIIKNDVKVQDQNFLSVSQENIDCYGMAMNNSGSDFGHTNHEIYAWGWVDGCTEDECIFISKSLNALQTRKGRNVY